MRDNPIVHSIERRTFRMHRTVRVAALAEAYFGSFRTVASRPRFRCLNAATRPFAARGGRREDTQRCFSQTRSVGAGAAEAVLKQAAADPSALTQEKIIENLDQVERGRLARIRNIGIAVCLRNGNTRNDANSCHRPILTVVKRLPQKESSFIRVESTRFMKFVGRTQLAPRWTRWNWKERRVLLFSLRQPFVTG